MSRLSDPLECTPESLQVNLVLYFYEDSYRKEVTEVYWSCFVEVEVEMEQCEGSQRGVSYPYELL